MYIGTTFDYEQCINLNTDYKKVLERIIDLKLSPVRVGIKWSKVENEKGRYDWEIYDGILEKLNSKKIPIILTIGVKSPRWPEFYIPGWINYKYTKNFIIDSDNKILLDEICGFIQKVYKRYKHLKSIKSIQLENEPFVKAGPWKGEISLDFIKEEIKYLKRIVNIPIHMTTLGIPNNTFFKKIFNNIRKVDNDIIDISDVLGIDIYTKIEDKLLPKDKYTYSSKNSDWKYIIKLKNKAEDLKKEVIISELQAEPWQRATVNFEDAYGNKTCNPSMVLENLDMIKSLNINTVLLWGTEFHIACEMRGNNKWVERLYLNKAINS